MRWVIASWAACTGTEPVIDSGSLIPTSTDPLPPEVPEPELGTWDPEEPVGLVVLAPSAFALGPVTVWWQQRFAFDVRIEFRVDGGAWQASPSFQGVRGLNEQSLIGIPVGATAEIRLVGAPSVDFTVHAGSVTTPSLPAAFPPATVSINDEAAWGPTGRYFLTSINQDACDWCDGRYWTFIADREGTVYWAIRSEAGRQVLYPQISTAGGDHVLWDELTFLGSRDATIHRTYLDREIEVIDARGHHHAFLELPDGTLVWGDRTSKQGEAIVELAPGSREPRPIWTCTGDWVAPGCRSNSLYYDATLERYWFSFYTNGSVVEVDRSSGGTVWSSRFDESPPSPVIYDFDPPTSQFDWQHGVVYLGDDRLLISTDREVDVEGGVHTVLAEYEIDRAEGVLREVWTFDPGYDAKFNGETRRRANGNTMHVLGARSIVYEVTRDKQIVWQIEYADGKMINRLEFLDDLWALMAPPPFGVRIDDRTSTPGSVQPNR